MSEDDWRFLSEAIPRRDLNAPAIKIFLCLYTAVAQEYHRSHTYKVGLSLFYYAVGVNRAGLDSISANMGEINIVKKFTTQMINIFGAVFTCAVLHWE